MPTLREKAVTVWHRMRRRISVYLDSKYNSTTLRSEQLPERNTGIILSHHADPPPQHTLLVLGNGRGGTSMLSGVLYHLGVFMGDDCTVPSYEDQRLTRPIVHLDRKGAARIIDEYSSRYPVWGYKHPQALNFIIKRHGLFRNPRLIIVVKDVAAIATRYNLVLGYDPLRVMDRLLIRYRRIARFAHRSGLPALIVSYEKALMDPAALIDAVQEFAGLSPTEEQLQAARDFIEPESGDYSRFSRRKQRRVQNGRL